MVRTRARRHILLITSSLVLFTACSILPVGAAAFRTSVISAAPAESTYPLQPRRHHSALPPVMSPDIMPLLPSPGADDDDAASPSDVAATIPSSLSPPNPDALEPDSAFAPFGYAPNAAASAAQSAAASPSRAPHVAWALTLGLAAMWLV